jgi:hypothetical protein
VSRENESFPVTFLCAKCADELAQFLNPARE